LGPKHTYDQRGKYHKGGTSAHHEPQSYMHGTLPSPISFMDTAHVTYLGGLRNEATHLRSGQVIVTDAPPDNKGRGEAFSPTDLLSTSLACCMMTLMGIAAQERDIELGGLEARVVKHMASGPRRVERLEVHLTLDGQGLDDRLRKVLEHAARTCPVAMSLREDLIQEVTFTYR
jgi:putative redox protein